MINWIHHDLILSIFSPSSFISFFILLRAIFISFHDILICYLFLQIVLSAISVSRVGSNFNSNSIESLLDKPLEWNLGTFISTLLFSTPWKTWKINMQSHMYTHIRQSHDEYSGVNAIKLNRKTISFSLHNLKNFSHIFFAWCHNEYTGLKYFRNFSQFRKIFYST